jgi:hypothetical protein
MTGLFAEVIDVYEREVFRLLLADVEVHTVHHPGDSTDRNDHISAAEQVSLLQQHVAHVVIARVDDKSLDPPDLAVGGIDALAAVHFDLVRGREP